MLQLLQYLRTCFFTSRFTTGFTSRCNFALQLDVNWLYGYGKVALLLRRYRSSFSASSVSRILLWVAS
jgi:hypothetical protein